MIPVFEPLLGHAETTYVLEALQAGEISGHSGRFIADFEHRFAALCGCEYGVAVSSGTAALHLASRVVGIRPGDHVMVSALTNIATALGIVQCGGRIIPIDSEPATWNLDPALLESQLTDDTTAIYPVHIYGHPADMPQITNFARRNSLIVVEDAAEAHGATIHDEAVGGFGHIGCFSFYANKVITSGEGGMLVTNNRTYADRARLLRNLAFDEPRFLHRQLGYNYRMTNLAAAIGLGQLARFDQIVESKRRLAGLYSERLFGTAGLTLPTERQGYRNVYWMYCLVVDPATFGCTRDDLRRRLLAAGIDTRTMFCPLNLQPALAPHLASTAPCPVAESLWENGLYLPSSPTLTEGAIDYICETIKEVASCPR